MNIFFLKDKSLNAKHKKIMRAAVRAFIKSPSLETFTAISDATMLGSRQGKYTYNMPCIVGRHNTRKPTDTSCEGCPLLLETSTESPPYDLCDVLTHTSAYDGGGLDVNDDYRDELLETEWDANKGEILIAIVQFAEGFK